MSVTVGSLLNDTWMRNRARMLGIHDKTPREAAALVTENSIRLVPGCSRKTVMEMRRAIRSDPEAAKIFDERSRDDWSRVDEEHRALKAQKDAARAARKRIDMSPYVTRLRRELDPQCSAADRARDRVERIIADRGIETIRELEILMLALDWSEQGNAWARVMGRSP